MEGRQRGRRERAGRRDGSLLGEENEWTLEMLVMAVGVERNKVKGESDEEWTDESGGNERL